MEKRTLFLLVASILVLLLFGFVFGVHPFMTITRRVPANLLLVEGWLSHSELCEASDEFRGGDYELMVTTGGPVDINGSSGPESYAALAGRRLVECGVSSSAIQMVHARFAANDQSAETALAFRTWLDETSMTVTGINVFTSGIHGRRSRTLYRRVLGDRACVGVVSTKETRYSPTLWFLSRTAIRKVLRNAGGYLYYRFFLRVAP